MPHRSHTVGWTIAFVVAVVVGLAIIVSRIGTQPEVPSTGLDPSELSTGPSRAPERPGDATVVIRVTSDVPMAVSCLDVPAAVRPKDRKLCVKGATSLERRMRVDGPVVVASANGVLGALGGQVRCRVVVDGDVRHRVRAEGPHQGAYCTAAVRVG